MQNWSPVADSHVQATPGEGKGLMGVQREAFFGEGR